MPSIERIKRKAQNAAYAATEKAQEAAAAAGEKAGAIRDYAGGKRGAITKAAKTNVLLVQEKRNLSRSYRAIGEWYVATYGDEAPDAIADIVNEVRLSRARIEELKARDEADGEAQALSGDSTSP